MYESGLTGPEGILIAMRAAKTGRARSSDANVVNFTTIGPRARAELEVTTATQVFLSLARNQFMAGVATNGNSRQDVKRSRGQEAKKSRSQDDSLPEGRDRAPWTWATG